MALGGRNAITMWSWSLTSVAALVVAAVYDTEAFDLPLWPRLLLVTATQIVSLPFVIAAHAVLARLTRPMPLVGLGLMVALGAVRGIIIMILAPWIEPLAIDSAAYHVAINVAFARVTLPFIAMIVDALRRHRALHARFVGEQEQWNEALRSAEMQFNAEAAAYQDVVDRNISAAVVVLLDDLDRVAREAGAASAAADQLRRLSAEVVRPLSHELILRPPSIDVRDAPGRILVGSRPGG